MSESFEISGDAEDQEFMQTVYDIGVATGYVEVCDYLMSALESAKEIEIDPENQVTEIHKYLLRVLISQKVHIEQIKKRMPNEY